MTTAPPGPRNGPAPRTNVLPPRRPLRSLTSPRPCRFCGRNAYLADADGALHPCCEMWRAELEKGRPCPACSSSEAGARKAAEQAKPRRRR